MGRRATVIAALVLPALLGAVLTARPALACSCAEATLADMVEREPGVAVGVVRRIDRDGGTAGVGAVVKTLHGSLPEQVPLNLDDGGSCRPYLGVGQVATLSFQPAGGTLQTLDCGMLDTGSSFEAAFGALQPDPQARGRPAVVLGTDLPGTELVALDRRLAVLATAAAPGADAIHSCGDDVLVSTVRGSRTSVSRYSLPELERMDTRRLDQRHAWLVDVRCTPQGRVTAVVRSEGRQVRLAVYPDLLEGPSHRLPVAEDAVVVGDEVLLLSSIPDAPRSVVSAYDLTSGTTSIRRSFDFAAYSLDASPDTRHIAIRGYDDDSVLMVLETDGMSIVGRTTGSWMPPEPQAWINDELLVLINENHGMGDVPEPARLVNTRLAEVGRVGPTGPGRLRGSRGLVLAVGGAELAVAGPGGAVRTSDDVRTAAAWDAVAVGRVAPAGQAPVAAEGLPAPTTAEPRGVSALVTVPAAAAVVVAGAAMLFGWRRRRRTKSAR